MDASKSRSSAKQAIDLTPLSWPPLSVFKRLQYFFLIWLVKFFITFGWVLQRRFLHKPSGKPTLTKVYPCRPKLKHHIFFPKSYKSGDSLPLYINIHGGGFAFGTLEHDEEFCIFFANQFNLLVANIEYSLSPLSKFPEPTHDVAAVVLAILSDTSLPIDTSRVAIGGFSAGGNLALSACQIPALQGKIQAVIPWYAPVDWSVDYAYKLASRPYKRPGDKDGLAAVAPLFNNVYLPTGTDQRDPLLSILYAKREELPEWIYAIGAEYDMLCDEARRMMAKFAGLEDLTEDERMGFEREGGRLRWAMAPASKHSFTHWWLRSVEAGKRDRPVAEKWILDSGAWLMKGPFAKKDT